MLLSPFPDKHYHSKTRGLWGSVMSRLRSRRQPTLKKSQLLLLRLLSLCLISASHQPIVIIPSSFIRPSRFWFHPNIHTLSFGNRKSATACFLSPLQEFLHESRPLDLSLTTEKLCTSLNLWFFIFCVRFGIQNALAKPVTIFAKFSFFFEICRLIWRITVRDAISPRCSASLLADGEKC